VTFPRSVAGFVALALLLAGCGGGGHGAKADAATTTTKPPAPIVAPLTGVVDPGGVSHHRPAVTVKIDNTQSQGLKYGVDEADVVYEEVTEGYITRLAAIFNSHAPDRVGPVRSVRKTDQSLVWPIGGIFAYSGGAPYAITSIDTAPVKQLDETRAGDMMFRDDSKLAPWNLYAHVDQMLRAGGKPIPPPPLFVYRKPGAAVAGRPVSAVHVGFLAGYATDWNWDAATRTWKRSLFGRPELTAAGVPLAPKNVVVMFTQYPGGDPNHGNEGAEARLVGTGTAWVFTGGHVVKGTWSRPDRAKPAQLLDAAGHPIRLTPGQTWVELPDSSYTVTTAP
jgi:Protein of unknown function (DUF3048) N-terminal domain/Protein of unknown function (DUF3048) C-terminal domain